MGESEAWDLVDGASGEREREGNLGENARRDQRMVCTAVMVSGFDDEVDEVDEDAAAI
jgi:hypothetical protein